MKLVLHGRVKGAKDTLHAPLYGVVIWKRGESVVVRWDAGGTLTGPASAFVPVIRYYAKFNGRQVGAIGKFYAISTTVEAEDLEAAKYALYERYEHITSLRMVGCPCGGFLGPDDAYVHAESCERQGGRLTHLDRR
ncbi:MAG: hypothetical protein EPN91_03575 [Salinibacterium sp.]|nr:MAG: hypothetical protein EPN91_03575 [Salinibacterium sp.]